MMTILIKVYSNNHNNTWICFQIFYVTLTTLLWSYVQSLSQNVTSICFGNDADLLVKRQQHAVSHNDQHYDSNNTLNKNLSTTCNTHCADLEATASSSKQEMGQVRASEQDFSCEQTTIHMQKLKACSGSTMSYSFSFTGSCHWLITAQR